MKYLSLLLLLIISGCDTDNKLSGSIDRVGKPIEVTVYTAESRVELERLYGTKISSSERLHGFANWNEGVDGEPSSFWCDIYIIQPKGVDDENVDTLGHEMAHCLWGSYHQ